MGKSFRTPYGSQNLAQPSGREASASDSSFHGSVGGYSICGLSFGGDLPIHLPIYQRSYLGITYIYLGICIKTLYRYLGRYM